MSPIVLEEEGNVSAFLHPRIINIETNGYNVLQKLCRGIREPRKKYSVFGISVWGYRKCFLEKICA